MDAAQMIIGVNLGVQKINSNAYDSFLDEEILYYINKATREYIRRQAVYLKKDLDNNRSDIISSSEAYENISPILKTYTSSVLEDSSIFDNGKQVNISNLSIFSYVYSQVRSDFFESPRICKKITLPETKKYSKTEYNDPIFREYPIVNIGNFYHILYDSQTDYISSFDLIFIKHPNKLVLSIEQGEEETQSTELELPEHTHDEIIDITVNMILGDIKSIRPTNDDQASIRENK